jgi:hypothetical protein
MQAFKLHAPATRKGAAQVERQAEQWPCHEIWAVRSSKLIARIKQKGRRIAPPPREILKGET